MLPRSISSSYVLILFFSLKFQVNDSIQRQEGILKEMTEVNGKFLGEKGGKDNGNARDDMLKKLAAAHDAFFELQKHLQEGTKFYNDLTQLLVTFQNKVSATYLIRIDLYIMFLTLFQLGFVTCYTATVIKVILA